MSGTQTAEAERVSMADPFAMQFPTQASSGQMIAVPSGVGSGTATDRAIADVFTAQRVAVKRDLNAILRDGRILAAEAGKEFFYSIPFKNRKLGTTEYVEGPTIGCAMAAVNTYGNCRVEAFPAQETATHWTFVARFVDYEKGVTVMRSFQQRKGQDTGMSDGGRATDIVFQIGQSKAIRNVVVGALSWLTKAMEIEAKAGVLNKVARNPDGARKWLIAEFEALAIDLARVERVVGRPAAKWLAPEMAKLYAQVNALQDGMANVEDLFPSAAAEADELREANEAERTATPAEPQARGPVTEPAPKEKAPKEDKPAPKPRAAKAKAAEPPLEEKREEQEPADTKPAATDKAEPPTDEMEGEFSNLSFA